MTKVWMYHCVEGRPGVFTAPPGDELLLTESPIDPIWLNGAVDYVVGKFSELYNVVTDNGQSTIGMLVGVFEGRYEPKEIGVARAARDQAMQKMFTSGNFKAQAVPGPFAGTQNGGKGMAVHICQRSGKYVRTTVLRHRTAFPARHR